MRTRAAAWALFIALLAGGVIQEEGSPQSVLRREDLARARENLRRHAWARDVYAAIAAPSSALRALSPEQLRSWVSRETPLLTVGCPACGAGPWYWSKLTESGEGVRCQSCNVVHARDASDRSEEWSVQAVIRYQRLRHVSERIVPLALAWQLEGDRHCADLVAAVVERFAEVYPRYRVSQVNTNVWANNDTRNAKIAGWKLRDARAVAPILQAYDLVRDSGVFKPGRKEFIETRLVRYVIDHYLEGYGEGGLLADRDLQDQGQAWRCLAIAGAILGDRVLLDRLVRAFERALDPAEGFFSSDGNFINGSPTYSWLLLEPLSDVPDALEDLSTRGVYRNPRCELWRRCLTWWARLCFPRGDVVAINDSHAGFRPPLRAAEVAYLRYGDASAREVLRAEWGDELRGGTAYSLFHRDPGLRLPPVAQAVERKSDHLEGLDLMILREGAKSMALLDYGGLDPPSHKHPDHLNLVYWALGQEVITDMGYVWNPAWVRRWQRSARSHNLILERAATKAPGQPVVWSPDPVASFAEAGTPGDLTRFLALIPRAGVEPLLIDVTRVRGEGPFTWNLHAASSDLSLYGVGPSEEAEVEEPLREGMLHRPRGPWRARWTLARGRLDVHFPSRAPIELTRTLCPPGEEVIAGLHLPGGALKPGATIPFRGMLSLRGASPFVAVYETAKAGEAPLEVTQHTLRRGPRAVALTIKDGETLYRLVYTTHPKWLSFGPLRAKARVALSCSESGKVTWLRVAGGEASQGSLRVRGEALSAAGNQRSE